MPSLLRLAVEGKWDKCNTMLDRGKGNVNERDPVRPAITTRFRHVDTSTPPHLCLL
jgi:hypothetical protein